MSIQFFWQLPADGDGRSLDRSSWNRGDFTPADTGRPVFARSDLRREGGHDWFDYLSQVGRAAEIGGFDGVLIPQTAGGEEPLIITGGLTRELRRLTLLPQLPAPFLSAVYAAKIAVSHQRLSGGRLAWYLTTEAHAEGDWHGHRWSEGELIARTSEFLDVVKGVWHTPPFTYHGDFYEVENGGFSPALALRPQPAPAGATVDGHGRAPVPTQYPLPTIHLSGTSEEALALSARHADVHVLPADSVAATRRRIEQLTTLAERHGRRLRFALRAEVVTREQAPDAWQVLGRVGSLQRVDVDDHRVDDLVWSGFARLQPGAPAGLVGSYADISQRIANYAELGVDTFLLSSRPALEEALHLGEKLLPRVRAGLSL